VEILKSRFTPDLPDRQLLWQLEPATRLTENEIKAGDELLQRLGIPTGSEYVCLGVRDAAYYKTVNPSIGYGQDLRDGVSDSRNVNIENYIQAATYLAERGIYVVRVGSVVTSPLPENRNPKIIDYAAKARSDLGDLLLGYRAKFYIVGSAGIWVFAARVNKPILYSDVYEIAHENGLDGKQIMLLFRLIKDDKLNQLVPFEDLAKFGHNLSHDSFLSILGLEAIPNEESEIFEATKEMTEWIDGHLILSAHEYHLQSKFSKYYRRNTKMVRQSSVIVSPSFLTKYKYLL